MKETVEKTEKVLDEADDEDEEADYEDYIVALNNAPIEYDDMKLPQKRYVLSRVSNVLYNGKRMVEKTHKK